MSLIFLSTLHKFICELQRNDMELMGRIKLPEEVFPLKPFCTSSQRVEKKNKQFDQKFNNEYKINASQLISQEVKLT